MHFLSDLDLEISAGAIDKLNESMKSHGGEIISFADKEKADLIIIGNRGLGDKATRFIMGSVATKVVSHASCNVYVVKSAQGAV